MIFMHGYSLRPYDPSTEAEMAERLRDAETWQPNNWFGFGYTQVPPFGPQSPGLGVISPDGGRMRVVNDRTTVGQVSWFPGYDYGGSPRHRGWGIGLLILPEHRRTRAASSALTLLIDYLFLTTTAHRIEATTSATAAPRSPLATPAGMSREGTLRRAQWRDGCWNDVVIYSILREEWEERRAMASPGASPSAHR
jgi:RimJ/RimL family protein N-acetyltransferase